MDFRKNKIRELYERRYDLLELILSAASKNLCPDTAQLLKNVDEKAWDSGSKYQYERSKRKNKVFRVDPINTDSCEGLELVPRISGNSQ